MRIKRLGSFILDILQVIVFAVALFLFTYLLILQPHKIKGNSMHPTFQNKWFLLTEKVSYRFTDPQRGDVVVFKAPPDDQDEFIKRVIGLPGDKVKILNGKVYINGTLLDESDYLDSTVQTSAGSFATEGTTFTVEPEMYFLVGDNRMGSHDSRNFGNISKKKFTGKAWVVYWPVSETGTVQPPTYNLK